MVSKLLQAIIKVILKLVDVILAPLTAALSLLLPDLTGAIQKVDDFFEYISSFVPLVLSYTGLDSTTLTIIQNLMYFIVVAPPVALTIKLAIKWYNALKL